MDIHSCAHFFVCLFVVFVFVLSHSVIYIYIYTYISSIPFHSIFLFFHLCVVFLYYYYYYYYFRLEEFKQLNPPVDLIEGAEMEMTIRGDTLLYKNATGGVGAIKSRIFTQAMCDVYYGDDAVSPSHKESVLEGIPNL